MREIKVGVSLQQLHFTNLRHKKNNFDICFTEHTWKEIIYYHFNFIGEPPSTLKEGYTALYIWEQCQLTS